MANVVGQSQYVVKPGPLAGAGWFLSIPAQGGGIPVQIISLTNAGTSGAVATVKQLDASGYLTNSQYGGVYIIPYPAFAEVNDRGMMTTFTPTSGTGQSNVRYMQISKSAFLTF